MEKGRRHPPVLNPRYLRHHPLHPVDGLQMRARKEFLYVRKQESHLPEQELHVLKQLQNIP